jgi:hypothetical protein
MGGYSARRAFWSKFFVTCATVCFVLGALLAVMGRNFFRAESFGDRAADSLDDPRLATFVADRITNIVVAQSPDLIAARPIILGTVQGLVSSPPFRALVRQAARRAHAAIFSTQSRQVVLAVPDVEVLLRSALAHASPQMAAKIPERLQTVMASANIGSKLEVVVDLWRFGWKLRWSAVIAIFVIGPLLLGLGLWIAHERQRALLRAGISLLVAGFVLALFLPAGRLTAALLIHDPLVRGAVQALYRTYMAALLHWSLLFGGLGVLFTAAGTSVLQGFELGPPARRVVRSLVSPPAGRLARLGWGSALIFSGLVAVLFPGELVAGAIVLLGVVAAFLGVREIFRLVLESAPAVPVLARVAPQRRWKLQTAIAVGLVLVLAGVWVALRLPEAESVPSSISACNGNIALCDRRVDQVVFAGAHNAMSNAQISDWMFPHHQTAIPQQLQDGIRALLVDVHYGFPGAARIKTDLDTERPSREMLEAAVGAEGVDAALRIRERLVGADEGRRGLYLCHGFCELGGYEFEPVLGQIRDFLIQNPTEVLILVLENYVSCEDLVHVFQESGLEELGYTGAAPPWPTLRELIESGQRLIVFIEKGTPAVAWQRPTIGNIQETPYMFHSPEEFSCQPNRGGTNGALFQMNHWIQTTPNPEPSNAAVVNAYDFLLGRARECARERNHLPNILAVDFYRTGDLFRVVQTLNGLSPESSPKVP